MAPSPENFGSWRTAADGTAHYVLGKKALCGARVKPDAPPPVRAVKGATLVTPLCVTCVDLNAARWAGESGAQAPVPLLPQRYYWWRHRKTKPK